MCRHPAPPFLVRLAALWIALGAGVPLPAQSLDASTARQQALRARAESLQRRVDSLAAAAREEGLDTLVQVRGVRLRTSTTLAADGAAALEAALSKAAAILGAEADSLASRVQLTLRAQRASVRESYSPITGFAVRQTKDRVTSYLFDGTVDGRDMPGSLLEHPLRRRDLAASMLWHIERAVARRIPTALDAWLNHRVPLAAPAADFEASVYRMLATDPAAVVRKCAAGDQTACRLGFALDSLPANRVAAWYDASDLPSLAANAGDHIQRASMVRTVGADGQAACTTNGDLDQCRRMLALLPMDAFRIPMPAAARESLMRLALSLGGALAMPRLRAARNTTLAGQLAAVAGVPADQLIERWARQMVAARPSSPLPNATFAFASLACIAVCAAWAIRGKPWN